MEVRPLIGISAGDLSGIGLEVVLKSIEDPSVLEFCTPIIYASISSLEKVAKTTGTTLPAFELIQDPQNAVHSKVNLIESWKEEIEGELGIPDEQSGLLAFRSLTQVTQDLSHGSIDALVTAPIDKFNIQSEHFKFPGHTEYLGSVAGMERYLMLLVSDGLRVGVVTGHIPVSQIADKLTAEKILTKLQIIDHSLKHDFGIAAPKIAVLGLNPHAGDNGLIGSEEKEVIIPAIEKAEQEGIHAEGPFPADGFFGSSTYKDYDAILAMYHDQGLVPFKALSFGSGVNFTAGLPFVRTSPDHGTAFDIAGKNLADSSSFKEALQLAVEIVKKRRS